MSSTDARSPAAGSLPPATPCTAPALWFAVQSSPNPRRLSPEGQEMHGRRSCSTNQEKSATANVHVRVAHVLSPQHRHAMCSCFSYQQPIPSTTSCVHTASSRRKPPQHTRSRQFFCLKSTRPPCLKRQSQAARATCPERQSEILAARTRAGTKPARPVVVVWWWWW